MGKTYKPTALYALKIGGTLGLTLVGLLVFNFAGSIFSINLPNIVMYVINGIIFLIGLFVLFMVIITGVPSITIKDDAIVVSGISRKFSEIAAYRKSRGGSEPYLMMKDGTRVDLELSWFTESDQRTIKAFIREKLTHGEA